MPNNVIARCAFILFAILIVSLPAAAQISSPDSQVSPLITSPIDNSVRMRIPHSTHPRAISRYEAGPLEANQAMQRMILVLKPSPDQQHQLQAFLDSQQTKGSPDYHHWLTPAEFGARFGPSQQDIEQVTSWLGQQGFTVNQVARGGRWIEFSGAARQVQAAFQTQMKYYQIKGKMHVANASDISVPAALSPVVGGVLSLHNFFKKPLRTHAFEVQRNAQGVLAPVQPDLTVTGRTTTFHFLAPGDFAKIYDLNPLYSQAINGQNQSIAIVARSDVNINDVRSFRQTFLLPANDPVNVINGPDPGEDLFFGDGIEATLDTEWSGAVAPSASINVVVSGSTLISDGVDLSAAFIVENNLAGIMSVSFGDCEHDLGAQENAFWNSLWQQAAAQGISVFVSSGDDGAAGCDDPNPRSIQATGGLAVSGLASTPFNTAVGGTEFNENGNDATFWNSTNSATDFSSAIGYIPEVVWNESCSPGQAGTDCQGQTFFELFAGSGGVSTIYSKPGWQSTSITGVPNDGKRDLPDVSLTAAGHDGFLICFETFDPTQDFNCISNPNNGSPLLLNAGVVGGTSASSPSFAGIMALVDQKTGGRQGLANYVLYSLAGAENFSNCNSNNRTNPAVGSSCVFNDITTGNNNVPGLVGFNAGTGFDLTTGLGSVDAKNLVNGWPTGLTATITSITTSMGASVNITHGQSVTLTGQVQKSPSGTGPTGTIAFVTDKAGPQGGFLTVGAGNLSGTPAAFIASFNNLPGGTYNLSAHYPGDGTFAASNSAGIPVTVAKENSSVSLQATLFNVNLGPVQLGPIPYGDTNNILVFDGTAIGASGAGFPSGTMSFADGNNGIGSVPMNNRAQGEVANCFTPITCLTVGTHQITASYPNGDNSFNASGPSSAVSITITKGNPTVQVNAQATEPGATPVSIGSNVFTGLGVVLPTGTVQFFDGGAPLGSPAQVISGGASIQATFNSSGTHNLTAQYSGDSTYNGATSPAFTVSVLAPFQFATINGVNSATVAAGGTATYTIALLQFQSNFNGAVSITCTGAPAGATCTTNPATTNPSSGLGTQVTVTVATTTSARLSPSPFRTWSPFFAAVVGILVCGAGRKRKHAVLMVLGLLVIVGVNACGGGGGGGGTTFRPPTIATLTVTGTSGSFTSSVNLNLTITH
jgi:large repetitive protein